MENYLNIKSVHDILDLYSEKFGLEFHPFLMEWYNEVVNERFHLEYPADTYAICITSTPSFFEKSLVPYLSEVNAELSRDPLDQCVTAKIKKITDQLSEYNVETLHDYELHDHIRRPKLLVQSAGHVSGAAYYYQKIDVEDQPWEERKIYGVSVHPKYGGWFAFRGTMIFKDLLVPTLEKKKVVDKLTNEQKISLLEKFNYHWQDWSYRDVFPVEEKYSDLQKKYFDTKPADRFKLVEEIQQGNVNFVEE